MENITKSKQYRTLLREHRELVAEHERLESDPFDKAAHDEHRRRLIDHNARLHDYIAAHFPKPTAAGRKARSARAKSGAAHSKPRKPAGTSRRR